MPNVLKTDSSKIHGPDCNPQKQKKIVFEGSILKIISGANTLCSVDLSNFGVFGSENGGSVKRSYYIPAGGSYTLTVSNISQDQGEVSMIVLFVNYDNSLPDYDRRIQVEYKGNYIPCGNMLFLTGTTIQDIPWHGWDMSSYDVSVTSPQLEYGGLFIYNPTIAEIEVQILVMN